MSNREFHFDVIKLSLEDYKSQTFGPKNFCSEKGNEIKVRGIERRRHEAPIYFKNARERF